MSITSYSEDLIPEILYAPSVVPQSSVTTEPEKQPGILRDISGCVAIFGPIQICYDLNLSTPSAAISLKVAGVTVVSGEISPQHPCLELKGDYSVAKWDLEICLRIPEQRITLSGKACVTFKGCKSFDITLFHWGQTDLFQPTNFVVYHNITVTKNGVQFLPHAISLNTDGTRATVTTSNFDGVLSVGQQYTITVLGGPIFTAKYVGVDGLTYKFDNLHQQ
ncbi:hypothetical protein [Nostoc sp. 2RC]|uniref:hypothetical protein n=1 Tax=Nostoc sp. 2RC TaxID=2485484 RepID=UPI00162693F5|nr:hypothetical protein [Nostoc sp. 2RC]MBC1241915.1 hypothetical protein [Nostoc sp. 2RC]